MNSWNSQKANYNLDTNMCLAAGASCNAYIQLIWAATSFVGCGKAQCGAKTHLVCNYGPGPNMLSGRPYQSGTPCSMCPARGGNTYSCEDNLCTLN
ncbi:peptidase inhibitor 16-like isoform X1 [Strongylocentrotus purpuratus]|uniref:SCP domain-containing protein n=1 Tax=Strongylocentrotus purpuratus TaxID=7668 RepID=A0A7M7HP23_STRPU|nr:peptidase inhibitor 16-like isoform X1 [Strongylocentrotus purpuratus]|eukprot:XP_011672595.1 PREDICTED: peptidase inhibitor 16-like isoform X1 [Strongylocentrotus purpuratus]